jgi:hypothetical protein
MLAIRVTLPHLDIMLSALIPGSSDRAVCCPCAVGCIQPAGTAHCFAVQRRMHRTARECNATQARQASLSCCPTRSAVRLPAQQEFNRVHTLDHCCLATKERSHIGTEMASVLLISLSFFKGNYYNGYREFHCLYLCSIDEDSLLILPSWRLSTLLCFHGIPLSNSSPIAFHMQDFMNFYARRHC